MKNMITDQKKDIFSKKLYNRKNILAGDFREMGKVKREVGLY